MNAHCLLILLRKLLAEFEFNPFLTTFSSNRFEKYIGGKYLGELVRCVLYRLYNEGLFLRKSIGTDRFPEPWSFNSDQISEIELYKSQIYRKKALK